MILPKPGVSVCIFLKEVRCQVVKWGLISSVMHKLLYNDIFKRCEDFKSVLQFRKPPPWLEPNN